MSFSCDGVYCCFPLPAASFRPCFCFVSGFGYIIAVSHSPPDFGGTPMRKRNKVSKESLSPALLSGSGRGGGGRWPVGRPKPNPTARRKLLRLSSPAAYSVDRPPAAPTSVPSLSPRTVAHTSAGGRRNPGGSSGIGVALSCWGRRLVSWSGMVAWWLVNMVCIWYSIPPPTPPPLAISCAATVFPTTKVWYHFLKCGTLSWPGHRPRLDCSRRAATARLINKHYRGATVSVGFGAHVLNRDAILVPGIRIGIKGYRFLPSILPLLIAGCCIVWTFCCCCL